MVFSSLQPHGLKHARLPCPSLPRVCSNSRPLCWWCHSTISTSVATRSLCDLWKFFNQLELLFSHSQNGKQWYPSGLSQETRNHTSHLRSENLIKKKKKHLRTCLVVQWLRIHTSSVEAVGSIPGLETKIPHATWQGRSKQTKAGGLDSKASVCNAGDPGLIPGLGRSPGEGNGNPLQYSYL